MQQSILFLSYWYPVPANKSFGIFIKRHAHALALAHPVIVLAFVIEHGTQFYKKNSEVFTDEAGITTHQITITSRFNKLVYVFLPLHFWILQKYIRKNSLVEPGTIIHSNILFPCAITGYKLAKKFNCPHVISEHWSKISKFFSSSFYKTSGKKAYDTAAAITCVSQQLAETVKKFTSNKNVSVVPNVIDSSRFFYNASIKKKNILTFIAVAHWSPPKNPFYFTEALEQLYHEKALPEFQLVLVGTGVLRDKIVSENYAYKIEYIDSLNQDELSEELNRSHVFLHGSDYETFSVVIAEAAMCGLPCIVSNVGIATEVISESNGAIAEDNVNDWKDKIRKVSHMHYDHEKISSILKGKYDLQAVGGQFSSIYKDL
ncbi:MAG: glycosyltransferase family 4 protein [Bacteroidetes bacterium]|nr:glycosyltransferase family 4 protein [Bacteroidota bacterium]